VVGLETWLGVAALGTNIVVAGSAIYALRNALLQLRFETTPLVIPFEFRSSRQISLLNAGKASAVDVKVEAQEDGRGFSGEVSCVPPEEKTWIHMREGRLVGLRPHPIFTARVVFLDVSSKTHISKVYRRQGGIFVAEIRS